MTIYELMDKYNISRSDLAKRFDIPYRTVQNWTIEGYNHRECPQYIINMMDEILQRET